MDLTVLTTSLQSSLGSNLPAILGALGILILGWIIAVAARAGVKRLLGLLYLNDRVKEGTEQKMDVESGIAVGVFWLILLITIIGVFNALDLEVISAPFAAMVTVVVQYLPHLLAGLVLLLVAWVIATMLRMLATKALGATQLDEKLASAAGMRPVGRDLGNALFWIVIVLFVPAILSALNLGGLLEPVQTMLTKLLDMLPNVFAAALIGFAGWLIASVLRGLVVNLLAAAGADRLPGKVGLGEAVRFSRVLGTIVFLFVFIPSLIAALDALKIESISAPATSMLERMLQAIPQILAAALILVVTYFVARFVSQALARLLNGMGFDALPSKLGMEDMMSDAWRPSDIVAALVLFFSMLFASAEAANRLDFGQVRELVTTFIQFAGDILLGAVILVIGYWLSNLLYQQVTRVSGGGASVLAQIGRVAILGLVLAMGLRAMGIADDIVNLAFGLTLGAVAVAVALSFGLGGREAAGRQLEHWFGRLRDQSKSGPSASTGK